MSDLISRQDAINLLKKWADGYSYIEHETELAIKAFEQLPPAQLERGHWVEDRLYFDLKCSNCGERPLYYFNKRELDFYLCRSKYCPNCGAKTDEVINE